MRRWNGITAGFLAAWLAGSSLALAQGDSFEEAVNLKRLRKGNVDWETQELIASGMTALHEEHQRILKELEELKTEIQKLKEGR